MVHFHPLQTICLWFRRVIRSLLLQPIRDLHQTHDRKSVGRDASPPEWVIDSQSIKASHAKKVVGNLPAILSLDGDRMLRSVGV